MSADLHRRYMWLAVAYLAVAAIVVAITAAFFSEHYEEEVGTWRRVAAIALLGLVLAPLLVLLNSLFFKALFPEDTGIVVGSLAGAVFAGAAGALAARYTVSSRALRSEGGSPET